MSNNDNTSKTNRHELDSDSVDEPIRSTDGLLDRRDYLKLTGATAAAAAAGVGATGTAAAEDYDTITVGANETKKYVLEDGDTLENKLFDISADQAYVRVRATGGGWTIRNIGFRGKFNCHDRDRGEIFSVDVLDEGGHGLVENVYFGDKATIGHGTPIFVGLHHAGTITIRNGYFRHWPGHAVYGAAPGRSAPNDGGGGGGEVHIENCYARNNNLDNFRIGTDGSYVKDSVVHVDDDVAPGYNDPTKVNARGIWVKEGGHCTIKNCDILLEHPDASYCIWEGDKEEEGLARVRDCQLVARDGADGLYHGNVDHQNVGHNPDVSVPSGVPTSPKQAAKGGGGTGGSHLLQIEGSGDRTDYSFTVSNNLKKTTAGGGSIDGDDEISGQSASGFVGGGTDSYTFDGELLTFDFEGAPINVLVDGEAAHVGQLPEHCLQIEGSGSDTDYNFTVSGNLKKSEVGDASINDGDEIINGGMNASGGVSGGTDAYKFDGDLVSFDFDGAAINVLLDGQPAHVGQRPDHFLQIEGSGSHTDYDFTVGSNLEKSTAGGASVNSGDEITNNQQSASGGVGGGTDAFTFDGDLRAFDFDGAPINVLLDGQSAHVGQLPDDV